MAGAGYKLFNTGDVLTAAQVNTYLQEQAVMRFANSTARTTALSSVLAEGMMSYLDDTNSVEVYNGSAWVSVGSTGDITEVLAGTGISGGGTSGSVTITNSIATTFDAKGDLVVGTGADTFAKLTVGTNDYVLTAASGEATGLKWAAPSASSGPTFSVASNTAQSVSQSTNTKVTFQVENWDTASNFASSRFTPTTAGYYQINAVISYTGATAFTYRCLIYKNGASWDNGSASLGVGVANPSIHISSLVYLNGTTDYVELYGWTDSTGTREFYRSYMDGVWIRS